MTPHPSDHRLSYCSWPQHCDTATPPGDPNRLNRSSGHSTFGNQSTPFRLQEGSSTPPIQNAAVVVNSSPSAGVVVEKFCMPRTALLHNTRSLFV